MARGLFSLGELLAEACGTLVYKLRIKLSPPALKGQTLIHWTAREVLNLPFLKMKSLTVSESSEQGQVRVAPAEELFSWCLREATMHTGVCGMGVLHSSLKRLNEVSHLLISKMVNPNLPREDSAKTPQWHSQAEQSGPARGILCESSSSQPVTGRSSAGPLKGPT